jgi:Xaa-Pro aminopeptidase
MSNPSDRINHPIPDAELDRRWTAIRSAMGAAGIDVLLAQASNDFMGGYVKYLTDIPATNGYVTTVVFPRDEPMIVVGQGAFGTDLHFPDGDLVRRGVGRFLGTPSYASAHYSAGYDAELAASAMGRYVHGTVGMLGTTAISLALVDSLRTHLPGARFIDASEVVDPIKAVKSADELALVRRAAAAQDLAMREAMSAVRPGIRELEIAAIAEEVGHSEGSEQGLFLSYSGPARSPGQIVNRHLQHRVLEHGDQYKLLIENNGPGGFYCELGRSLVIGEATAEVRKQHAFILEAQDYCVDRLHPGANSREIWEAYNTFMRENGRPEERRVHFHGQGYDMVERPLVRGDETMPIEGNMYFALHPAFSTPTSYSFASDDYLLHPDGRVERLHEYPRELIEIG